MLFNRDRDDAHQFKPLLTEIETDPGSPLGPITFWLVIGVFVFFVLWAIFGQVDIVISARGKVIPMGQVKTIQPLNGGVISQILVREGDFVRKGQTLVVIDPSSTEPGLQSSKETLSHIEREQARLAAAATGRGISGGDTQARLLAASRQSLQKQLDARRQMLANLQAQMDGKQVDRKQTREELAFLEDREKRLREVMDIIARDDYEKVKNDIRTNRNKLNNLDYEISQIQFQQAQTREEMAYLQENFQSTTLTSMSDNEKQITQLEAQIQESTFKNAQQTLKAPVDGYVTDLAIHTVGGVVTPAEKLISIVPVNTPLMIEATVMNRDIGFVQPRMPVAIKIDTFEFQKYGTLDGRVAQVDKDSHDDEKLGPVYTAYITPLENQLKVEGRWQKLASGMSVTAEIKTGKRRIIEFFIYPLIKNLNEGMSVR